MCGIWDWQSTIVLNDSQDPKHTLFCRENGFVAIYTFFFKQQMSVFTRGGCPKQTLSAFFFYNFSYMMASLIHLFNKQNSAAVLCSVGDCDVIFEGRWPPVGLPHPLFLWVGVGLEVGWERVGGVEATGKIVLQYCAVCWRL